MLSVIYYAIEVLKIKNILICGHYGCGGIHTAMNHEPQGFIDNWLNHIRDVYDEHGEELTKINDLEARERRLVELSVKQQAINLSKISFIQNRWKKEEYPHIHGIIFDMETGKLKNLGISFSGKQQA